MSRAFAQMLFRSVIYMGPWRFIAALRGWKRGRPIAQVLLPLAVQLVTAL